MQKFIWHESTDWGCWERNIILKSSGIKQTKKVMKGGQLQLTWLINIFNFKLIPMFQALYPTDLRYSTWMLCNKLPPSTFHRVADSRARLPEFKSANFLTSLCLSFTIWKMWLIKSSTSQSWWEDLYSVWHIWNVI